MALRLAARHLRHTARLATAVRFSGGYAHHNDKDPTMPEEYEVLGGANDQQMIVDTDPYVNKWTALVSLIGAGLVITGVYKLAKWTDPESKNPAAPREMPFNNLYKELGADPDKPAPTAPMYKTN